MSYLFAFSFCSWGSKGGILKWFAIPISDGCRRKWQPTAILLPGKSQDQKSLVGSSPWSHKESDTIERLHLNFLRASLLAQRVKHLPVMWETQVREDLLEKEWQPPFSILVWRIPWTEEPGGLQSMRSQRVGHDGANTLSPIAHVLSEFCTRGTTQI